MQKQKDADTQWMRCIAAFFVVLIHAVDLSSRTGVFFSALARFSVPVFVLISGWYLLGKQRSFGELAKRSGILFLQLVLWGCIQFSVEFLLKTRTWHGFGDLFITVLSGNGHFWYLYAMIGLYLFTPVFQIFCQHADKRTYDWALILTFFFGSLVTIALRTDRFPLLETVISNTKIPYSLGFIFLYLMGDRLRRYPPKKPLLWGLAGLLGMVFTVLWSLRLPPERAAELSLSFFFPGNILGAIGFFVAAKRLFKGKDSKAMLVLAACTSGIYLSHMIALKCLQVWLWPTLLTMPSWLAYPLFALAAYLFAFVLTLLLKQIPGLRRLV